MHERVVGIAYPGESVQIGMSAFVELIEMMRGGFGPMRVAARYHALLVANH